MNFEFTEEQVMIKHAARDFAKKLEADVIERDYKAAFPTRHIEELSELGFLGMMIAPQGAPYRLIIINDQNMFRFCFLTRFHSTPSHVYYTLIPLY